MSTSRLREREICLQYFFALPTQEQLIAYRAIRDYLGGRIHASKRDQVVEERAATLEAIRRVAVYLELDEGRAPTPREFEVAARELGLDCGRSRVQRAWGRWRFAKEAFLGTLTESAAQRDLRLAESSPPRGNHMAHLGAAKRWLSTKPHKYSTSSYNAWAREYNDRRSADELPAPETAWTIANALGMKWRDAVLFARGEIAAENAEPIARRPRERNCRGPYDLVSLADIQELLVGKSRRAVAYETHGPDFPNPVVITNKNRLWLRGDIEAYAQGRLPPHREMNELGSAYVTLRQVAAMTGLSWEAMRRTTPRGFPSAAVRLGRAHLWLKAEVEEWVEARAAAQAEAASSGE